MKLKVGDKVTVRKDLKTGRYGADVVVRKMLDLKGVTTSIKKIHSNGAIEIVGSSWYWTPEMLVDKPSGKIIGYRCLNTGGKDSWWSVGKVYELTNYQGAEVIVDDEGVPRFIGGKTLPEIMEYLKERYGTVFEPVYAEPSTEDLIERIKEDIERLNKYQENLFGKRDRINEQAIKLGSKARKLEEVLEVLEEYK